MPVTRALKLETLDGNVLAERLEAIRESIPALDVPPRHLLCDGGGEAA